MAFTTLPIVQYGLHAERARVNIANQLESIMETNQRHSLDTDPINPSLAVATAKTKCTYSYLPFIKQTSVTFRLSRRIAMLNLRPVGYAILGSILEFTPNTTSFNLNEERHNIVETENGESYTPFDILTTTYTWDAKNKKFQKE